LAPNITNQPVSQVVTAGQAASFTVAATGIPSPSYQWLKAGTNLLGATNPTLAISNAQPSDAGTYSAVVSNGAGIVVSTNVTLTVLGTAAAASFTASPTTGTEPLVVSFTDTSAGTPPLSLLWSFGDSTATNTAGGAMFSHAYTAGVYTVTLTASNAFGSSTLVSNSLVTVISAFQAWQLQYFGCTNCSQAQAGFDADGTGQNNQFKYVAGLDPTNPASVFLLSIKSVANQPSSQSLIFTPLASGRTYTPQFSTNLVSGVWFLLSTYTGPATNGNQITVTDTNALPPREFYRIDISLP
jgi:PKD repeat protein